MYKESPNLLWWSGSEAVHFIELQIDNTEFGSIPEIWEYPIPPPPLFTDDSRFFTVPHTEQKATCSECKGSGQITCPKCHGRGKITRRVRNSNTGGYRYSLLFCIE